MTVILNTERSMVRTGTTSKFLTIKPGKLFNSRSSGSKKQHGFLNGDEMTWEQTAVTSFLKAAEIQIPRPRKSPSAPLCWTSSSTVFLSQKHKRLTEKVTFKNKLPLPFPSLFRLQKHLPIEQRVRVVWDLGKSLIAENPGALLQVAIVSTGRPTTAIRFYKVAFLYYGMK